MSIPVCPWAQIIYNLNFSIRENDIIYVYTAEEIQSELQDCYPVRQKIVHVSFLTYL